MIYKTKTERGSIISEPRQWYRCNPCDYEYLRVGKKLEPSCPICGGRGTPFTFQEKSKK